MLRNGYTPEQIINKLREAENRRNDETDNNGAITDFL